jgi:uncharacterized protein DUF1828
MNCAQLFASVGFTCRRLEQPGGEVIHAISTPFQFFDGDGIHVFIEEVGPLVRLFDGGETMFHVAGSGIKFRDNRSISPIKKLIKDAGADFSDDGEISALAMPAEAHASFQKVISAILAVADWESENAGLTSDTATLAAEVEFYLRQWKPAAEILRGQSLPGISGRNHEFEFMVDGQLIDVVSSRPQSTAAEVRKLADVSGIPSQARTDIKVIIDDRPDHARAAQEAAILSRFAEVWLFTNLQGRIPPVSITMN